MSLNTSPFFLKTDFLSNRCRKSGIDSIVQTGFASEQESVLKLTPKGFLMADEVTLQLAS